MSEQEKPNYMGVLDQWSDANVIAPLVSTDGNDADESFESAQKTIDHVKYAIREKVLESYKNGIKAGIAKMASRSRKAVSHVQA